MRTIRFLRNQGFSITTLKQLKKHKLPDLEVLSLASQRNEILITEDRGFGSIIDYPLYSHQGILLISTKTRRRETLHSNLLNFLKKTTLEKIKGKLFIFEDYILRIRQ